MLVSDALAREAAEQTEDALRDFFLVPEARLRGRDGALAVRAWRGVG